MKIDHYNFELYHFKVCVFFGDTVYFRLALTLCTNYDKVRWQLF